MVRTLGHVVGLAEGTPNLLLIAGVLHASDSKDVAPSQPEAFALLKSVEGSWTGTAQWDMAGKKGSGELAVGLSPDFRRPRRGGDGLSGTPGEMVTIYHVQDQTVGATHYCKTGRHPRFVLEKPTDPKELVFRCLGGINMKEADSHMHGLRLTVPDSAHLKGYWSSVKDGRLQWEATADLVRKPAANAPSGR